MGAGGMRAHARPNGSILLICAACTFLTHYNKSINCVRVSVMCVCTMHEEEIGSI